jgi:hypothetical protein
MIVQVNEIYAKVYEALQENVDEVLPRHAIHPAGKAAPRRC